MSKYDDIIEIIFFNNYKEGDQKVAFTREELAQACDTLNISRIKNLGDIPYTYRFRRNLPDSIKNKAPINTEMQDIEFCKIRYPISLYGLFSYLFDLQILYAL